MAHNVIVRTLVDIEMNHPFGRHTDGGRASSYDEALEYVGAQPGGTETLFRQDQHLESVSH
jgi:hypothetical protein